MRPLFTFIAFITLFIVYAFSQFAANEPLTQLKKKLKTYVKYYAPEKTYLQTDKPYYASGDTIWFQAYLVDGIFHRPSKKSQSLYVELISPEDTIIASKTLLPLNGGAGGDFPIPEEAAQGTYLLRAYTNYMRNQSNAYFFQQSIPIWKQDISTPIETPLEDLTPITTSNATLNIRPQLRFYPEGGDLVDGMNCVVGVKAILPSGSPLALEGKILDSQSRYVMSFKTYDMGIGTFTFLPKFGETYTALITINGVEQSYPLPQILQQGYTLSLRNTGNKVSVKAKTNIPNGLEGAFLIGHFRGAAFFESVNIGNPNEFATVFSTTTLGDGVATFTLFTKAGEPVCERLIFIENSNNDLTVKINTDKATYQKRQPVNIRIDLEDLNTDSIFAQVAVAITDKASVQTSPYAGNIKTWLLLNSDLRGAVDNPGFYFEKPGDRKRQFLLDALMLTQGWRRFVWRELPLDSTFRYNYPIEKGIIISGTTTKWRKQQPIATNLSLSFIDGGYFTDRTTAGVDGKFEFGPYLLLDTSKIVLQARITPKKEKKKKKRADGELRGSPYVSFRMNAQNSPPPIERFEPYISPNDTSYNWLKDFLTTSREKKRMNAQYDMRMVTLDEFEVVAKRKKKTVYDEIVRNKALYSQPSNRVIVDSSNFASNAFSIFELLRTVPGVRVFGTFPNETVVIRGQSSITLSNAPTYVLDGAVVSEGAIQSLPVQDVYFIDVLKGANATIYGAAGGTGVIAVYTRTGSGAPPANADEPSPGILTFLHPGYYKTRQFYTPDYSEKKDIHVKPDFRTTLFWQSNILMANRIDSISFFTSDQASTYQIKVEGITLDGRAVYGVQDFVVE